MSNWTAASSDCSRPANNYVRVNTVDLYTPNARFTPERLGYQVLTLFGKLGYSQFCAAIGRRVITEFNYRLGDRDEAHIFVGIGTESRADAAALVESLTARGYATMDLSADEMAKLHIRHLVGGHAPRVREEYGSIRVCQRRLADAMT